MTWVKLDDHFDENPKILKAGPLGAVLWTAALAYCNRNNTRGLITRAAARKLIDWEFFGAKDGDGQRRVYRVAVSSNMAGEDVCSEFAIDLLLEYGLWEVVDEHTYRVHDYEKYQLSPEDKSSLSKARAAAGRRGGQVTAQRRTEQQIAASGSKPAATAVAKIKPVPVPVPARDPAAAPAEQSSVTRAREAAAAAEVSPELRRCFTAWEQQSPGGLLKPIADHLADALEAYPVEWIETACRSAAENGGYKPWKYIDSTLQRMKREGGASSRRKGGELRDPRDPYADLPTPELSPELAAIVRASQEDAGGA